MGNILESYYVNATVGHLQQYPNLLVLTKGESLSQERATQHMHSYLELFYFESGSGFFVCGQQKIPLRTHTLLIVNAAVTHRQFSDDLTEPLIYYNLAIDDILLGDMNKNELTQPDFAYRYMEGPQNSVYQNILQLLTALKQQSSFYFLRAKGLLYTIFADVCTALITPKQGENEDICVLRDTKRYIQNNHFRDLKLEELAKQACMSSTSLQHKFMAKYQISPIQYLILVRIENAKLLLIKSGDSISDIAAKVGFNSSSYFSEVFKKHTGLTPRAYREQNRQSG